MYVGIIQFTDFKEMKNPNKNISVDKKKKLFTNLVNYCFSKAVNAFNY